MFASILFTAFYNTNNRPAWYAVADGKVTTDQDTNDYKRKERYFIVTLPSNIVFDVGYVCVSTVVYDNRPRSRHNWYDNLFFRSLEHKNLFINLLVVSVEQCCIAFKFGFAVSSSCFDSEYGVFMN